MDIPSQIRASSAACDGGEAEEDGGLLALRAQERGGGDVGVVAVGSKDTVGTSTTGVDRTFGDL